MNAHIHNSTIYLAMSSALTNADFKAVYIKCEMPTQGSFRGIGPMSSPADVMAYCWFRLFCPDDKLALRIGGFALQDEIADRAANYNHSQSDHGPVDCPVTKPPGRPPHLYARCSLD